MKTAALLGLLTLSLGLAARTATAQAQTAPKPQEVLPRPEPTFKGKIARTAQTSTRDFPKEVQAPAGAPTSC